MEFTKKPLTIGEEEDHIGYFSIMLFLTIITFIGIVIWENPMITEYKQIDSQYSFIAQKHIICLELGYLFFLSWIIYSYKKLAYNYAENFKAVIISHKLIALYFTLYSQSLALIICKVSPEIEIFEKSNGFIGKEVTNAAHFLSFISISYVIITVLFLAFLRFSTKIFQQAQTPNSCTVPIK